MAFIEGNFKNYPQIRFLKQFLTGHPGIIAGGCFKSIFSGKEVHDIDMFFRNINDYKKAVNYFRSKSKEYTQSYSNKNVEAFIHIKTNIRIECVKKIFGSPEELLKQFDFTITKFAYEMAMIPSDDEKNNELTNLFEYQDKVLYHENFFEHLLLKRLVVDDAIPFPVSTYNRTYKYAKAGFIPCRETKFKIMQAIHDIEKELSDDMLDNSLYDGVD